MAKIAKIYLVLELVDVFVVLVVLQFQLVELLDELVRGGDLVALELLAFELFEYLFILSDLFFLMLELSLAHDGRVVGLARPSLHLFVPLLVVLLQIRGFWKEIETLSL